MISNAPIIVITGASSYLGSIVTALLLEKGFIIRATSRNINTLISELDFLSHYKSKLFFYKADLLDDENIWFPIVNGSDIIIHIASPNDIEEPKNPIETIINPGIQGIETIFYVALKAKVSKIIFTSCITVTVCTGKKNHIFNENDWAIESTLNSVAKGKYLTEKRARQLYENNKDKINFTVVVPGLMLGPSYKKKLSVSSIFVKKALEMKAIPKISFPIVDVRDVAQSFLKILENSDISNGKRYLLVQGSYWWADIITIARIEFNKYGYKFPNKTLGSFWVKIYAFFGNSLLQFVKPYLDGELIIDTSLYINELNGTYRKIEETIIEFGYDLIKKNLIEDKLIFTMDDKDPPCFILN